MEKTNKNQNIIDTRKIHEEKRKKFQIIHNRPPARAEIPKPKESPKLIDDNPHDFLLEEHSEDVFFRWRAPEFETFERDKKWYLLSAGFLFLVILWAIWSNSPVMAITFILIGVVEYIYLNKTPRVIDFFITSDGIIADKEIFDFENIDSFWIFYEPGGKKSACLHAKSGIMPYIHIPIHEEDPVHIRQILLEFLPEEKKEPGLVETMERLLKI